MAIISDCTGIGDSLRICNGSGLHPSGIEAEGQAVNTGSTRSTVQVYVYRTDSIVTAIIQGGDRPGLSPGTGSRCVGSRSTATAVTEATWQLS
jgi:hypothetical protein